jgi:hypothetical protein
MLKRLIVLAAALAMVFAFVSTSSAGESAPTPPTVPSACEGLTSTSPTTDLAACVTALADLEGLPAECQNLTAVQITEILACVADLTPALTDPPAEDPDEEGGGGYGAYDDAYDTGYDEGVPEGGVASGIGPTGSDAAGAPLVARGAALLAVLAALATGLLIMRRRQGS